MEPFPVEVLANAIGTAGSITVDTTQVNNILVFGKKAFGLGILVLLPLSLPSLSPLQLPTMRFVIAPLTDGADLVHRVILSSAEGFRRVH